MKTIYLLSATLALAITACSTSSSQLHKNSNEYVTNPAGVVLKDSQRLVTPDKFTPPVEINIVAQTDSTNLRLSYTARQVIFNWERDRSQLRIDGGPASGLHQKDEGLIPENKDVNIRWVVTSTNETLYVNNRVRFKNTGDYSKIDDQVAVFPAHGSVVTVKSLQVKHL